MGANGKKGVGATLTKNKKPLFSEAEAIPAIIYQAYILTEAVGRGQYGAVNKKLVLPRPRGIRSLSQARQRTSCIPLSEVN